MKSKVIFFIFIISILIIFCYSIIQLILLIYSPEINLKDENVYYYLESKKDLTQEELEKLVEIQNK